jgi:hypothetical protein
MSWVPTVIDPIHPILWFKHNVHFCLPSDLVAVAT